MKSIDRPRGVRYVSITGSGFVADLPRWSLWRRRVRLRGFAAKTVDAYIHPPSLRHYGGTSAMEQLWAFYRRSLERLSCEEAQCFLDEIITVRKLAWATVNVYFSAYRFLYEQVLKRQPHEFSIPPRWRSGTRPGVLSQAEVRRIIAAPLNIKHRALLAMTYGSGLRVSEYVGRLVPASARAPP